jgi:hypothetical protein
MTSPVLREVTVRPETLMAVVLVVVVVRSTVLVVVVVMVRSPVLRVAVVVEKSQALRELRHLLPGPRRVFSFRWDL